MRMSWNRIIAATRSLITTTTSSRNAFLPSEVPHCLGGGVEEGCCALLCNVTSCPIALTMKTPELPICKKNLFPSLSPSPSFLFLLAATFLIPQKVEKEPKEALNIDQVCPAVMKKTSESTLITTRNNTNTTYLTREG